MTYDDILELKIQDGPFPTIRTYLGGLLRGSLEDGADFSGKRPFGHGNWKGDLHRPLIKAGLIHGRLDEDGDIAEVDSVAGDQLLLSLVDHVFAAPVSADLTAARDTLDSAIAYLRAESDPDWQTTLAHLKLARQCLADHTPAAPATPGRLAYLLTCVHEEAARGVDDPARTLRRILLLTDPASGDLKAGPPQADAARGQDGPPFGEAPQAPAIHEQHWTPDPPVVPAWPVGAHVRYIGPRDLPNLGALRVIPSLHGYLTRVTDGRAEFSASHRHFTAGDE
ncbi:hypothetical protein [Deinococcus soli (ex Cha et al. 2016)]|uniref:Uncharacterized protein n=2 Tax=Deinococcus soli (ex Cha et al. 2016) TaxID=1309411 RepID=A0ACC6KKS4_9DEIO|nr:hypothetical protein [Deinococcus soli (ex Cha et al. 2016)]MDR6218600.1 hypothetical protein [Deinococcus soli (ex Cha et al. 2016)]MDR6328397.1 hypothetical protein [Deinococcus soli (ex Cha et al. 2016)]MDR6753008.1 hypothetical protein [Deinococcus soli (ex Cha et al. 2016)]